MSARFLIIGGWVLLMLSGSQAAGQPVLEPACANESPLDRVRELRYVVNARVRPLLFWIGRENVGDGWIVWSRAGTSERVELLVGSDPLRTPRRVNRWGYIAETSCERGVDLLGVMTESQEASIEEASAHAARSHERTQAFRAIRASVNSSRYDSEVGRVLVEGPLTYRDLPAVLTRASEARGPRRVIPLAQGTAPGFLSAVATLASRAVSADARSAGRLSLPYVYNGQLFDLLVTSLRRTGDRLDTEFQTRNRGTGRTSTFWVSWSPGDPPLPRRIRFRPRWWFEAEMVLDEEGAVPTAGLAETVAPQTVAGKR